jgi:hypothetical protein
VSHIEFIFPRRIARLSYFVRNVALTAVAAMFAPALQNGTQQMTAVFIVLFLAYWGMFIVAPRCRDTGLSPWCAFVVLVPVVNIFVGGYLTWKSSWPSTEGIDLAPSVGSKPPDASQEKSDSLRRLEALRDEGVLTEQDFLRRKARLEREGKG